MSDQETQSHGDLFVLDDAGDDHPTATPETNKHHHVGILKRRSPPSSSDQDQEPTPRKKPNLTMLNLPLSTPIQPSNFSLHRTLSAPPISPPENIYTTTSGSSPSSTAIRRSISDIAYCPSYYDQVIGTIAPSPQTSPPPLPEIACSDSSVRRRSPNFEKMKKLEEMTKEISLWCEEAMRQMEQLDEEEEEPQELKEEDGDSVSEMKQAVSVDRAGECLTIHFECPCGKGYQILLSDKNCYYKLVQF